MEKGWIKKRMELNYSEFKETNNMIIFRRNKWRY